MSDAPKCIRPGNPKALAAKVSAHLCGSGCYCYARGENECGCARADWRPRRQVAAETALKFCLDVLKAHHMSRPGISRLVEEAEAIQRAGESIFKKDGD